ncbi:MAG: HAMP domain-containing histidine kinase [Acidobacteria bacterium]|nr:HAMP domain-containing histidine kinase [Acidobacteriota bacterium]
MPSRRVTRFRPHRLKEDRASLWRRLMMPIGAGLMIVAGLALVYVLYRAPYFWSVSFAEREVAAFSNAHWGDMLNIERHWQSMPPLPKFERGDTPEVAAYLSSQPLVVALLDRSRPDRLWVRDGDHFHVASSGSRAERYRRWVDQAIRASLQHWNPPREEDPDFGKVASVVLLGEDRVIIKSWVPGSPEVERALRVVLGPAPSMRMGLVRSDEVDREDLPRQPWGAEPAIQADPGSLAGQYYCLATKSTAFGDGWDPVGIPFEKERKAMRFRVHTQLWIARGAALFVGLAMLGGLWLRYRVRQRAILDADRMASLTHSLKTPLAILKFRCDSLRLGRLGPAEADAELIKLGSEVDELTLLIENGLRAIRGISTDSPEGEVSSGWIAEVVDDLRPVFEAEGRRLDLRLSPDSGLAALTSLRSALQTLIENAIFHGRGTVSVESWKARKRFFIRVADEGPGLNAAQLEALGKPFMRIRAGGGEGFHREGQGLGLSLLFQVAEREGWGLEFGSSPGQGLEATLEIRAI